MARALIIVDVQPTFTEGGALGVEGGNTLARRIADYAIRNDEKYDLIVTTQDWHVDPGEHFSDNPDYVDTWPPHGIAGTEEAELHPALGPIRVDYCVKKGEYEAAYSGFEGVCPDGTTLADILSDEGVDEVDIVGIALSHCVKQTALDAAKIRGLHQIRVLTDLTVPVSADQGEAALEQMGKTRIQLVHS
ncbi:isochorismatase family protein [Actinomycetaceae bacterium MB13-C1-2]|nr:isochorismatase family protein [Actinomycetaceae bacterium MB13-C1-2]